MLRTVTALAGIAVLSACTPEATAPGVGFGSPGGYSPAAAVSSTATPTTAKYDDGFMYGRLIRTSQGGTDIATLDKIRYHNIFAMKSTEEFVGIFRQQVSSMTGCNVTHVSQRTSNFNLTSVSAILDCG